MFTEKSILTKIATLANINNQLYSLNSFSLITFIFHNILSDIVVVCTITFFSKQIGFMIFILIIIFSLLACFYLAYLVYLNRQITQIFGRICTLLKNKHYHSQINKFDHRKLNQMNLRQSKNLRFNHGRLSGESKQTSSHIGLQEIKKQFRPCFELRLFRLVNFDFYFMMSLGLACLNYIVFLLQTN